MAFCPRCGAQLPDGATFCAQCGQPLTPVTPNPGYYSAPAPQPAPAPKKKRSGLVVILILVLLAVGGYFLYDYLGPFGGKPDNDRDWSDAEPRESVLPDGEDDGNTMTNKEYRDWLLGD